MSKVTAEKRAAMKRPTPRHRHGNGKPWALSGKTRTQRERLMWAFGYQRNIRKPAGMASINELLAW